MQQVTRWTIAAVGVLVLLAASVAWYQLPTFRQARLNQRLVEAVNTHRAADVAALLAEGADPNSCAYLGDTPSMRVRLFSYIEPKQYAIHPRHRVPVLTAAVDAEDINTVEILLNKGANINGHDSLGISEALPDAAYFKRADMVGLLLNHVPSLREKNDALEVGIRPGNGHVVQLLLASGTNINEQDPMFGMSALEDAVVCDDATLVKLLLAHGASPNLKDRMQSRSILGVAENRLRPDITIIRALQTAGAKI